MENQDQFKQKLEPLRALQKQELDIRQQLRTLRNQIRQQVQINKQTKNYTALVAALNDMILLQPDIDSIESAAKASFVDWQQYHKDCQANNASAITSDLQKLQSDLQVKITALQKLLTGLQTISQDLNIPASPAFAPKPSLTSNLGQASKSSVTNEMLF